MSGPEFTSEQISQQAQGNQTAFVLGTLAYFKEHQRSPEEWVVFLGSRFAPSWESVKGQGAKATMEAVVLNFVSAGGTLQSFSGDETQAEAVMTGWPPAGEMEPLGLTFEDIDPFYEIFTPIATYLNLRYAWHRQGNQVTFTFTG